MLALGGLRDRSGWLYALDSDGRADALQTAASPVRSAGGIGGCSTEVDGLAVGCVQVRAAPLFTSPADLGRVQEALLAAEPLERIEPAVEVGRALLGSTLRRGFDLSAQGRGPLAPGEDAPLRKMHRQREGARLPGLRENPPVVIGR